MKIKQYFKDNKEGAIGGALVGAVGYFAYSKYMNMRPLRQMMMDSSGLIDKVITYMPKENLAAFKLMILFVIIGAVAGMIFDSYTDWF